MEYVALVTLLIAFQYLFFMVSCALARGKSGLQAPAVSGDPQFECHLRVQQNTLEQLMLTLPAICLCASFFRTDVAAVGGAIFLIGRFLYRAGYISEDANRRGPGMLIGFCATLILLCCATWGVVVSVL